MSFCFEVSELSSICLESAQIEVDCDLQHPMAFCATSHCKSPRDRICGTVNRLAARASLQAPVDNKILAPSELFIWATTNINGIKLFML